MARSAFFEGLNKLFKYLATRNVRVPSKGLPKGMGITRQGRVKKLKGGQRILRKPGGGTTFLKKSAKVGMTRGQKAGAYTAGGALAVGTGYQFRPTGPSTVSQRQMASTKQSGKPAWHSDVAKWSKSGYHIFKASSPSAKAFRQSYALAKKSGAKEFTWKVTGKKYKVP